jgi:hypothetical protein
VLLNLRNIFAHESGHVLHFSRIAGAKSREVNMPSECLEIRVDNDFHDAALL